MSESAGDPWSELLAAGGRARRLRTGEVLFRRGEPAQHVFRVRSGAVRLERTAADGSVVILLVARAPETLAEAALFSSQERGEYHCDARAEGPATVEAVSADLLRRRLADDPELANRVIVRLARQLREVRALLELRAGRSARDRVLRFLALFGERAASGDVPLQTIALQIGLRPETFYRTVARLESAGLVVRNGRRLVLASSSHRPAAMRGRRARRT